MARSSSASSAPAGSFRVPGVSLDLETLLRRVDPAASPEARAALLAGGAVLADGVALRKLRTRLPPGTRVELRERFGPEPGQGVSPGSGLLQALVPALPWQAGTFAKRRRMATAIAFTRLERRGGVDRIGLRPAAAEAAAGHGHDSAPALLVEDVLQALASSGYPVLGDFRRGGVLVEGGLRVSRDQLAWPEEPVFPGVGFAGPPVAGEEDRLLELAVSEATRRVLARGHPWVLRDDETGDTSGLAPGTRVWLRAPAGQHLGVACIEGAGSLVARCFEDPPAGRRRSSLQGSLSARLDRAWQRRTALLDPASGSDVFRLVHGEADGLPGLYVDRLGSVLRVLTTSTGDASYREAAVARLADRLADLIHAKPSVVEVVHLRDVPPGEMLRTRLASGPMPAGSESASTRLLVRERGVAYLVDPGLTRPLRSSPGFGLYPDQRENRARLAAGAKRGGRLLNLFAHTGAFSVAWLAAGGGEAVSVDLSAAYLRWLDQNLAANAIDTARHRSVRQDGRRFLETLDPSERFDAIVIDPPTAAAAGRRFWTVGRDLPPLVERALRHLATGGQLLVCRNDRRRSELSDLVRDCAGRAGVRLAALEAAGPGPDHPSRAGFPEGDPFSGLLVTRA